MVKAPLEKTLVKKLKAMDEKIKTSFVLIRKDVDEMQVVIDAMRKFLRKKDRQYEYARKEDNKIRNEFRKDVDEFTQKISQLKLALAEVRDLQDEVVTKKHLAQIEERIKTSFRNQIEGYKGKVKDLGTDLNETDKRIAAIESGYVREKKKVWFFKKKED